MRLQRAPLVIPTSILPIGAQFVHRWKPHPRRKRWHLHFTPTSSSWVDLVERWFKELFNRRLRRGVFTSVPDLIAAIELWAAHWNLDPKPFVWHKPAAEIIEKVRRGVPPSTRSNQRRTTRACRALVPAA